jgi:hypothetical protein
MLKLNPPLNVFSPTLIPELKVTSEHPACSVLDRHLPAFLELFKHSVHLSANLLHTFHCGI